VPAYKKWRIEDFKEAIKQATGGGGTQQVTNRVKHLFLFT
jgi:hypothetical protein